MESVIHNFDVFISYSRADYVDEQKNIISGNVISQIKEHFDKAGISYWMDETGIYCGDAWAEELAAKIEECSLFLFVSSENSNKSKWTRKELATAHMFDKTIIPFRVDESVYNKSVIMYIADLDYIDYYTNPTLAFNRLIDSILESKKKVEELIEQKHKEEQQLRRHEEQEQAKWVQEIESVCLEIEEFSSKSELARKKANHTLKKVSDKDKRIHLTNLINRSSSLFAKNLALVAEKQELQESIDDANTKLSELTSENETLLEQLNAAQSSLANAEAELKEIRSETERIGSGHTTNKPSKKRKQIKIFSIVAAVISLSLSLG